MATEVDLQRLVVQMEASFTRYQREWQKALGTTDRNVKQVQTRFDGMSKSINNAGANTARALDPIAGQTGNIAAQFQDIAVQLQGGQSPFLIAMQQGTQLSAVLSQSKSPIAALSSAFLQLVNPISLATIATIALGGAAVQWLTRSEEGVKSTDDAFEGHLQRIREITRGYEDAEKAATEYVERQRALPQEIAQNEAAAGQTEALEKASQVLDDIAAKQRTIAGDLQNLRLVPESFGDIVNASEGLDQLGLSADATEKEVNDLLVRLDTLARSDAPDQAKQYARDLYNLVVQFRDAKAEAGSFKAVVDSLPRNIDIRVNLATNAQNALQQLRDLAPELRDASAVAREQAIALADRASLGAQSISEGMAIASQLQQTLAAIDEQERRNNETQSGSGSSAAEKIDREREAVTELIAELQHEYDTLGLTEQQKAVANALRQAGAAATDAERQAITELVNATLAEAAAMEATNEQMREFADAGRQALQGYIQDMIAGKDATEALGNALGNIGDRLINLGLDALFGTGGGSFGALGQLFGISGARAAGGPVSAGQTYLVGEKGPELFTPPMSGKIVPNDRLGGGGAVLTFAPVIDARGADAASVARLERSMVKMASEMEGQVKQIVRTQGRKWK